MRGEDEVRAEREREADADAAAVHRGDDGLVGREAHLLDPPDVPRLLGLRDGVAPGPLLRRLRGRVEAALRVRTRAEGAALAREDDHAAVGVRVGLVDGHPVLKQRRCK